MIGKLGISIINFITLVVLFSLFNIETSYAARHGLLVGVSSYPVSSLEGPINDVNSVKKLLVDKWKFSSSNITVLLDKDGTKQNILKELGKLYTKTKKGDEIFLYFSGHGTSASDHDLNFPLPTTSGAFIPYDVRDAKTIRQVLNTLVIGKTDLKPILGKLDNGGRQVFVAIDACYSGNAVRGVLKSKSSQLPSRYLDVKALLPDRAFGDDLVKTGDDVWQPRSDGNFEAYPYKNVYYLSASGEHEQAKDIPSRLLKQNPTIDGKAHGAFTDTLLRVLSEPMLADRNNDGGISYHEITKSVRRLMRQRGFDHTPNGLPSIAEDKNNLASRGIFRNIVIASNTNVSKGKSEIASKRKASLRNANSLVLRVEIEAGLGALSEKLAKLNNVVLVKQDADIVLRKEGDGVLFVSRAGDLITRENEIIDLKLIKIVEHQAWVQQLLNYNIQQDFSINLDMLANGRGSVAVTDEEIGFSISSDTDSYLLLVDIDPRGTINVIYPYYREELKPLRAREIFIRENIARVGPPYGRDFVQVYAFNHLTSDLKQLVAATIKDGSDLKQVFQRLINDKTVKKASASIELVTAHR